VNPRALAIWSAAALSVALTSSNPVYRIITLLAAANVLVALRRRGSRLAPLVVALAVATALATGITLLLSHSGVHAFAALPGGVPIIGGPLTLEAAVFGATSGAGIAAAVLAVAPLSMVIDAHELVDALPRALARSGAAVATALNLIPSLGRSATEIGDAQRMRGWRRGRVRDWPEIAVPVVLTAVESSLALAEAMEARGYGAGARTHFRPAAWRPPDVAVAAAAVLAGAGFVGLRVAGLVVDWYPFPTVSVPAIHPLAVACCAALALPALVWHRP